MVSAQQSQPPAPTDTPRGGVLPFPRDRLGAVSIQGDAGVYVHLYLPSAPTGPEELRAFQQRCQPKSAGMCQSNTCTYINGSSVLIARRGLAA